MKEKGRVANVIPAIDHRKATGFVRAGLGSDKASLVTRARSKQLLVRVSEDELAAITDDFRKSEHRYMQDYVRTKLLTGLNVKPAPD